MPGWVCSPVVHVCTGVFTVYAVRESTAYLGAKWGMDFKLFWIIITIVENRDFPSEYKKSSRTAKWRVLLENPPFTKMFPSQLQWLHLKIRPSLIQLSLRYEYVTDVVEMFSITKRSSNTDCSSPFSFSLLSVRENIFTQCSVPFVCPIRPLQKRCSLKRRSTWDAWKTRTPCPVPRITLNLSQDQD